MTSIQELPVKTLQSVLKHLKGGVIGFDPFRDERTNTKAKLLSYILTAYSNEAIIDAIKTVETSEAIRDQAFPFEGVNPNSAEFHNVHVVLTWNDLNGQKQVSGFRDTASADAFRDKNTTNQWIGRYTFDEYMRLATSTLPKQAPTMPAKALPQVNPGLDSNAIQLAELLAKMTGKAQLDESKVKEICDARAQDYVDNILNATNKRLGEYDAKIAAIQMPVTVMIKNAETQEIKSLGLQHKQFPLLLKACNAKMPDGGHLNIWLKGPAGTGKTTAAKNCALALELPFRFNGAIGNQYELLGFIDAGGRYHRTAFRDAYEHGGVYLFDEIDSSNPNAVLAFNAALANGEACFPDGMITRHKDCVIIAGANTGGNGGTSEYSGRMKQDAAFLDRFVMIDWPLDAALERALSNDSVWLSKVTEVRANLNERKIKNHLVTPRATIFGEALLRAGVSLDQCIDMTLRKGLASETWKEVSVND